MLVLLFHARCDMIGTFFMYQFANYVLFVRKICRPGVLWFIRDLSDLDFHPVNDILDKPVLLQLRKVFRGALLYATVLFFVFGGISLLANAVQAAIDILGFDLMFLPIRTPQVYNTFNSIIYSSLGQVHPWNLRFTLYVVLWSYS